MPEIQMPKLSDTMTEGTVVSWKKKIGDQVNSGEVLAEIETDKATMEWEATEDGVLKKIYVKEGEKVNVGDRIAFIGGAGEEAGEEGKRKAETGKATSAEPKQPQPTSSATRGAEPAAPEQPAKASSQPEQGGRVKASPLARKI